MVARSDIYQKALDLLARREHSQQELASKLSSRFAGSDADIEDIIQELLHRNFLSDVRYAEVIVSHRAKMGYGPNWIKSFLRSKGVSDLNIDESFSLSDVNWFEVVLATRIKKFGQELPSEYKSLMKVKSFLQTRGFLPEHIDAACDMN